MYIKESRIEGLWGTKNLSWNDIRQDLSIVVGINGAGKTTLLNRLLSVVMQNLDQMSFFNYRMIPINYPAESKRVNSRIDMFFKLVNTFFKETQKALV